MEICSQCVVMLVQLSIINCSILPMHVQVIVTVRHMPSSVGSLSLCITLIESPTAVFKKSVGSTFVTPCAGTER